MSYRRWVENVRCAGLIKRTIPNKHHVYVLQVEWSDGQNQTVCRTYTALFDFKAALRAQFKGRSDIVLPDLPSLKWFERGLLAKNGVMESKQERIEEFCQAMLHLPKDVVQGPTVQSFFERWSSDATLDREIGKLSTFYTRGTNHERKSSFPDDADSENSPRDSPLLAHRDITQSPQISRNASSKDPNSSFINSKDLKKRLDKKLAKSLSPDHGSLDGEEQLYMATCEYKARRTGEVNLKKGCVMDVIQKDLSGWWFVYVEDSMEEGWAPGSYLEPVNPGGSETTDQPSTGSIGRFKTKVNCVGNGRDEIAYKPGEEAEVLEANMDGWWLIKCHGDVGYTPATNLQQVEEDQPTQMAKCQRSRVNIICSVSARGRDTVHSLYHHHSIYKKHSPPPRRTPSKQSQDLYAQVDLTKKHRLNPAKSFDVAPSNQGLDDDVPMEPGHRHTFHPLPRNETVRYAEVEFPHHDGGDRPVIRSHSPTQYTEVIVRTDAKPRLKENTDQRKPRDKAECYMNYSPARSYENIAPHDQPEKSTKGSKKFFRAMNDYTSNTAHSQGLDVEKGDIVMVESESGGRAYGVMCQKSDQPRRRPMEGWLPLDVLQPCSPEIISWTNSSVPVVKDSSPPTPCQTGAKVSKPDAVQTTTSSEKEPAQRTVVSDPEPVSRTVVSQPEPTQPRLAANGEDSNASLKTIITEGQLGNVRIQAICAYHSELPDVPSFEKGEKATKIRESKSGWLCVKLRNQVTWVPGEYWTTVKRKSSRKKSSTSRSPASRSPASRSPASRSPVSRSPASRSPVPKSPGVKTASGEEELPVFGPTEPWLVGRMSRNDCESLLLNHGTHLNFVIRESTNRLGDFTLSVKCNDRVKHFPIEVTQEGKFYIGKHGFKDLSKVVHYYQRNALFFDEGNNPVSLGEPLARKSR